MVVVFGGAFNPPTIAHKEIYFHIKKSIEFSHFIYLPVSNLYTKSSLISNMHRLRMLELLVKELENASVSSLELDDTEFLGTYVSLKRIQKKYNEEVAFVIGADNLNNLHNWKHAKSLLKEFKFIVINRNKLDILEFIRNNIFLKEYIDNFIILPKFNMNVSSTIFRETFDPEYVIDSIFEYIMQHNLY